MVSVKAQKRDEGSWTNVTEDGYTAYVSSFIVAFCWRNRDGRDPELHMELSSNNEDLQNSRYRYMNVPYRVYKGLKERSENPSEFDDKLENYFHTEIRDEFEYERYDKKL